jgi:hypothetical protein
MVHDPATESGAAAEDLGGCKAGQDPMISDGWLSEQPGRCYFFADRDCPGWSAGGTCSRIGDAIPAGAAEDLDPGPVPEDQAAEQLGALDVFSMLDAAEPGLLGTGRYALYKTPDGGLMISYAPNGGGEQGHMPIPAHLLRMGKMAASGKGPLGALVKLAGKG